MKKIILVNLLVFLILFVFVEFASYYYLQIKYNIGSFCYKTIKNPENEKYSLLRPIEYRSFSKSPVLLFGCSFLWGLSLQRYEIFSHKLANYTDRTVVNRAYVGEGPAFMYRQLNDENTLSTIKKQLNNKCPKVIIFNFISDHIVRTYRYRQEGIVDFFSERYIVDSNKELKRNQPFEFLTFFHMFYTVILFEKIKENIALKNYKKLKNTNARILIESYKIVKKEFPTSTFVLMNYPSCIDDEESSNLFQNDVLKLLKQEGVNDIFTIDIPSIYPQIYNREYWLQNDVCHPSSLAWEKLTPIIAEKLKLLEED